MHNFERETILEGTEAINYLTPFFKLAERELAEGFYGEARELLVNVAKKGSLFLKGRRVIPGKSVANVATAARAGQLVAGLSSEPISNQGLIAVEICEGKRPQPQQPIFIPHMYDGFMWVTSNNDLDQELGAHCPRRDNDIVLDILSRPQFREGLIVKINYPEDLSSIDMRAPTVIDSKGLPLWRKCKTSDFWGRTVAMHSDYVDGVPEAVHAVPCVLPTGTTLEKIGVCKKHRQVEVESLCSVLLEKTKLHSPL